MSNLCCTIEHTAYLFLDELVADHDGCLDGVGVHDLGGVVQTDVLREVHLLVVNFLNRASIKGRDISPIFFCFTDVRSEWNGLVGFG